MAPLLLQAGASQQQKLAPGGPTEAPTPFPGPRWAGLHEFRIHLQSVLSTAPEGVG